MLDMLVVQLTQAKDTVKLFPTWPIWQWGCKVMGVLETFRELGQLKLHSHKKQNNSCIFLYFSDTSKPCCLELSPWLDSLWLTAWWGTRERNYSWRKGNIQFLPVLESSKSFPLVRAENFLFLPWRCNKKSLPGLQSIHHFDRFIVWPVVHTVPRYNKCLVYRTCNRTPQAMGVIIKIDEEHRWRTT